MIVFTGVSVLRTIQAGRGLACLLVAAFHLSLTMQVPRYGGEALFYDFIWLFRPALDYFFVVSGFIITMASAKDIGRPERLQGYAVRRLIRLYPVYWLYTALALIGTALGLTHVFVPQDAATWVQSFMLFRFNTNTPPIEVAWTLYHEVPFYFLFGFLIWRKRVGIALFAVLAVGSLLHFKIPPFIGPSPIETYFSAYFVHFLLGMGAFFVWKNVSHRLLASLLPVALALVVVMRFYNDQIPETPRATVWAATLAFLIASLAGLEKVRPFKLPVLEQIGDASYSLYLAHPFIQLVALRMYYKFLHGPALFVAALSTVCLTSYAMYRFIEIPMIEKLRAWTEKKRAPLEKASVPTAPTPEVRA